MPKVAAALTDYKVKTLKPKVGQTGWRDYADGACEYLSAARDGMSADAVDARTRALTLTVAQAHAEYIETVGGGLRATTKKLKRGCSRPTSSRSPAPA